MKKIVFVMQDMQLGGVERCLISMLREIDPSRYDVTLIVFVRDGALLSEVPQTVKVRSIAQKDSVKFLPAGRAVRAMLRAGDFSGALHRLAGAGLVVLKKGRMQFNQCFWKAMAPTIDTLEETFDVAIAYSEGRATYFTAEKIRADRKITWLHIDYAVAGYDPNFDRPFYDAFDRVFAVSAYARDVFTRALPEYADRADVLYNLVPVERIRKLAVEGPGFPDDFSGVRILSVGRLTEQKGFDLAVAVMKRLIQDGRRVRWYILGEGGCRKQLEQAVCENGLQESFLLPGAAANPYPFFAQCDLYVQPSRYEGYATTVTEAKLLGKPVVATDVSGVREQIRDGENGVVTEISADSLYRAICALLDDPALRGRMARAAALDVPENALSLQKLYDAVEGA